MLSWWRKRQQLKSEQQQKVKKAKEKYYALIHQEKGHATGTVAQKHQEKGHATGTVAQKPDGTKLNMEARGSLPTSQKDSFTDISEGESLPDTFANPNHSFLGSYSKEKEDGLDWDVAITPNTHDNPWIAESKFTWGNTGDKKDIERKNEAGENEKYTRFEDTYKDKRSIYIQNTHGYTNPVLDTFDIGCAHFIKTGMEVRNIDDLIGQDFNIGEEDIERELALTSELQRRKRSAEQDLMGKPKVTKLWLPGEVQEQKLKTDKEIDETQGRGYWDLSFDAIFSPYFEETDERVRYLDLDLLPHGDIPSNSTTKVNMKNVEAEEIMFKDEVQGLELDSRQHLRLQERGYNLEAIVGDIEEQRAGVHANKETIATEDAVSINSLEEQSKAMDGKHLQGLEYLKQFKDDLNHVGTGCTKRNKKGKIAKPKANTGYNTKSGNIYDKASVWQDKDDELATILGFDSEELIETDKDKKTPLAKKGSESFKIDSKIAQRKKEVLMSEPNMGHSERKKAYREVASWLEEMDPELYAIVASSQDEINDTKEKEELDCENEEQYENQEHNQICQREELGQQGIHEKNAGARIMALNYDQGTQIQMRLEQEEMQACEIQAQPADEPDIKDTFVDGFQEELVNARVPQPILKKFVELHRSLNILRHNFQVKKFYFYRTEETDNRKEFPIMQVEQYSHYSPQDVTESEDESFRFMFRKEELKEKERKRFMGDAYRDYNKERARLRDMHRFCLIKLFADLYKTAKPDRIVQQYKRCHEIINEIKIECKEQLRLAEIKENEDKAEHYTNINNIKEKLRAVKQKLHIAPNHKDLIQMEDHLKQQVCNLDIKEGQRRTVVFKSQEDWKRNKIRTIAQVRASHNYKLFILWKAHYGIVEPKHKGDIGCLDPILAECNRRDYVKRANASKRIKAAIQARETLALREADGQMSNRHLHNHDEGELMVSCSFMKQQDKAIPVIYNKNKHGLSSQILKTKRTSVIEITRKVTKSQIGGEQSHEQGTLCPSQVNKKQCFSKEGLSGGSARTYICESEDNEYGKMALKDNEYGKMALKVSNFSHLGKGSEEMGMMLDDDFNAQTDQQQEETGKRKNEIESKETQQVTTERSMIEEYRQDLVTKRVPEAIMHELVEFQIKLYQEKEKLRAKRYEESVEQAQYVTQPCMQHYPMQQMSVQTAEHKDSNRQTNVPSRMSKAKKNYDKNAKIIKARHTSELNVLFTKQLEIERPEVIVCEMKKYEEFKKKEKQNLEEAKGRLKMQDSEDKEIYTRTLSSLTEKLEIAKANIHTNPEHSILVNGLTNEIQNLDNKEGERQSRVSKSKKEISRVYHNIVNIERSKHISLSIKLWKQHYTIEEPVQQSRPIGQHLMAVAVNQGIPDRCEIPEQATVQAQYDEHMDEIGGQFMGSEREQHIVNLSGKPTGEASDVNSYEVPFDRNLCQVGGLLDTIKRNRTMTKQTTTREQKKATTETRGAVDDEAMNEFVSKLVKATGTVKKGKVSAASVQGMTSRRQPQQAKKIRDKKREADLLKLKEQSEAQSSWKYGQNKPTTIQSELQSKDEQKRKAHQERQCGLKRQETARKQEIQIFNPQRKKDEERRDVERKEEQGKVTGSQMQSKRDDDDINKKWGAVVVEYERKML